MKRIILLFGLAVFMLVAALEFQAKFYSSKYAEAIATKEFEKYCINVHLNKKDFVGPFKVSVGNSPWAFEWKYTAGKQILFGVWLHQDGFPEVYVGKD